jgi:hypothetical protein
LMHAEETEFQLLLVLLDVFQLHNRSVARWPRLSREGI